VDAIVITGLSKSYVGRRLPARPAVTVHALQDLSVSVKEAEVFGFLGPNGAGKSTTIRLLLDLIRPSSGHARVLGLDVHRDRLAIDRRVSYVPGELSLYSELTVASC